MCTFREWISMQSAHVHVFKYVYASIYVCPRAIAHENRRDESCCIDSTGFEGFTLSQASVGAHAPYALCLSDVLSCPVDEVVEAVALSFAAGGFVVLSGKLMAVAEVLARRRGRSGTGGDLIDIAVPPCWVPASPPWARLSAVVLALLLERTVSGSSLVRWMSMTLRFFLFGKFCLLLTSRAGALKWVLRIGVIRKTSMMFLVLMTEISLIKAVVRIRMLANLEFQKSSP